MYKSKKWKTKRNNILKRDGYVCKECSRYGKRDVPAEVVHHIFPYEHYPNLGLKNDNLISLCNSCHNKMHFRESHELTKLGKEWLMRANKKLKIIK